jgi:hypothetical protein
VKKRPAPTAEIEPAEVLPLGPLTQNGEHRLAQFASFRRMIPKKKVILVNVIERFSGFHRNVKPLLASWKIRSYDPAPAVANPVPGAEGPVGFQAPKPSSHREPESQGTA